MKIVVKSLIISVFGALLLSFTNEPSLMERAEKLQRSILTLDTHVDTPMTLYSGNIDLSKEGFGCVDFPKMRRGALDMECFAVFTPQNSRDEEYLETVYSKAIKLYDIINQIAVDHPETVGIASCSEDIYRLKSEGKLIIMPTMENSTPIAKDITRLTEFYNKGARIFGLCHSKNNDICDSSSDSKGAESGGLSPFGEEVVAELNRIGGVIDVSHASDETFFDVVALSMKPIIASHSSVRAIANHDRNFNDEMLLALKENGGVIQICILDRYVKNFPKNEKCQEEISAARSQYYKTSTTDLEGRKAAHRRISEIKASYPDQNATIKDYVDHIDYVVDKIGIDHVGIGTDFDGGGGISDCKNVSQLIGITAELISRGYSDSDIEKIWGKNFIRVLDEVQKL